MKTINLKDINPKLTWIETKIKGSGKNQNVWLETRLKSFTGKKIKMFGGYVLTFEQWVGSKLTLPIASFELVSVRAKIWNRELKKEEIHKVIF